MWSQITKLRKVGGRKKFCILKGAHFPEDDATTFGSISPSPPPTSSPSDEHPLLLAAEFQQKLGITSPPQLTNSSLFRFDRAPYIPSSQFLFFFFLFFAPVLIRMCFLPAIVAARPVAHVVLPELLRPLHPPISPRNHSFPLSSFRCEFVIQAVIYVFVSSRMFIL